MAEPKPQIRTRTIVVRQGGGCLSGCTIGIVIGGAIVVGLLLGLGFLTGMIPAL